MSDDDWMNMADDDEIEIVKKDEFSDEEVIEVEKPK